MKVEFHDLRHEKWFVEAAEETTIGELKTRNASERKLDESSNQKLIFSGKILKDSDTLAGIKYAEGKGFIVCMVSRSRKPAAAPKKPSPTPEPVAAAAGAAGGASGSGNNSGNSSSSGSNSNSNSNNNNNNNNNSASDPQPAARETTESSAPQSEEARLSAFVTGEQHAAVVDNIVEMGYSRPQVLRAMRRAYNNPDRAVEYLVSGEIPDVPEAEAVEASLGAEGEASSTAEGSPADAAAPGTAAATAPAAAPATATATAEGSRDISSIDRNLFDAAEHEEPSGPDFQQMLGLSDEQLEQLRATVQRDPGSVMRVVEPVVRTHPELAHVLAVHLDDFVRFLHNVDEMDEDEMDEDDDEMAALAGGRQVTIEITPEEDAAIRRLMELGFDRQAVATAYIICDKDEQLTANYLLEHGADD